MGSFGGGEAHMGFQLSRADGVTAFINAWNWHPTVTLLRRHAILDPELLELMDIGCGPCPTVPAGDAARIAQFLDAYLAELPAGGRVRPDGSVTAEPDAGEFHREDLGQNYSATETWLVEFRDFCRAGLSFVVA
jgi:hypothetical protein